jgi:coenzyme PQQ biosynthesis protein PqqD
MIALAARPRLAAKARLRFDRLTGGHLLLYPERGLALNATATAIIELCSGERTVEAIAAEVGARFQVGARPVVDEVRAFLDALAARGLIECR